ncbi:MAG: 3-deoxy-D-manno-octulosonate 8-phosphate phosphatase (KDO 8-P phosphatase) [Oceanicoccus sp.]|jgi:3-deoxy-D-manno-octulosonate 8-phosphate phosphatase (KDO 8-P phosphatase)
MQKILEKAKPVRLLVLDVDGVLTDGKLYFSNSGDELKAFNILDGQGIKMLQSSGVEVAIITGRQSNIVAKRANNLEIRHLVQGREDKLVALDELRTKLNIDYQQIAYVGDDLPDLAAMRKVQLGITVANGHTFVAEHADWQTSSKGGEGAVREVCELIMRSQGNLNAAWEQYL